MQRLEANVRCSAVCSARRIFVFNTRDASLDAKKLTVPSPSGYFTSSPAQRMLRAPPALPASAAAAHSLVRRAASQPAPPASRQVQRRVPAARCSRLPALAEGAVDVDATVVDTRVPVTVITGYLGCAR